MRTSGQAACALAKQLSLGMPVLVLYLRAKAYPPPVLGVLPRCCAVFVALALVAPGKAWSKTVGQTERGGSKFQRDLLELESSARDCSAGSVSPEWCVQHLEPQLVVAKNYSREMVRLRSFRRLQRFAKLELFRALWTLGREPRAATLVREMVSTQPLSQEEILSLGPNAAKFAEDEESAVDRLGRGKLQVECDQACSVLVNETLVDRKVTLPYGEYRVIVCAADASLPPLTRAVRLDAQHPSAVVRRANAPASQGTLQASTNSRPEGEPSTRQVSDSAGSPEPKHASSRAPMGSPLRPSPPSAAADTVLFEDPLVVPSLPRRVVRAGIGVGLLGTMLGPGLMVMDGFSFERDCIGSGCPNAWRTKDAGIGILIAGGVVLLGSSIMLLAERIRGARFHARWLRQRNRPHRFLTTARNR